MPRHLILFALYISIVVASHEIFVSLDVDGGINHRETLRTIAKNGNRHPHGLISEIINEVNKIEASVLRLKSDKIFLQLNKVFYEEKEKANREYEKQRSDLILNLDEQINAANALIGKHRVIVGRNEEYYKYDQKRTLVLRHRTKSCMAWHYTR